MKHYKIIGIAGSLALIASCFMPWAYYPDLNESFTAFYSNQNMYGKPGKLFIFFAVVSVVLILLNRLWAKRTLLFIAAVNIAYLIKTYSLFTTCYTTICPEKRYGIYVLIVSCIVMTVAAVLPDLKTGDEDAGTKSYS